LSETTFLAAYSYEPLIGEPGANKANMFGLYIVDSFGNRELLYRDPDISSLWPIPVRKRPLPRLIPSNLDPVAKPMGTFVVQDVSRAYPPLPAGEENRVAGLRIVQVLPKTTPHANDPRVGSANASPGKQVLGTVPVESDGSAHFLAPANIPLLFQALDKQGRSIQSMRSVTYLQAGETQSCVGCHEPRSAAPPVNKATIASQRPPSVILPGPDGSKPFSYPLLVQPVLNKHCTGCHGTQDPGGGVALTARPEREFTESYNQLTKYVSYPAWGRADNSEPLSQPDHFGARGSQLMRFLLQEHYDVHLTAEEMARMITWMDTTALFYGTFDPADQARQRRGERIAGPGLE
jgi:mono/diheme cytochrome c family protein